MAIKRYNLSFEKDSIKISAKGFKGTGCNQLPEKLVSQLGLGIQDYTPTDEAFLIPQEPEITQSQTETDTHG